ncbi:uncharacterized protein C2845_PM16G04090 [Panicum miliaceum]|uniref:Uncharacterized protein n=1 Tax=Panicum miliaceum TaxID=4540 RepID=A0A3L6PY46_PANMI|nr:uncharacterized protein C2845_PM16G04090 [Panicum miliaceum]
MAAASPAPSNSDQRCSTRRIPYPILLAAAAASIRSDRGGAIQMSKRMKPAALRGGGVRGAGAHPLQCRALELCFSVALDRLPAAASAASAAAQGTGPPVSNALVPALKRAQAQQRRGCPEAAQQLLLTKVELEQPLLAIMREASFSSAVKSTIEQSLSSPSPAAPSASAAAPTLVGTTPLSPVPLCSLALAPAMPTSTRAWRPPQASAPVLDVMLKPARRNPVLVGDAGPDAVLKEAVRRIPTAGSPALAGAKVLPLEALAGHEWEKRDIGRRNVLTSHNCHNYKKPIGRVCAFDPNCMVLDNMRKKSKKKDLTVKSRFISIR